MKLYGPDGKVVKVNDENRLLTETVSVPLDHHLNSAGGVFSSYFKVTPAAANDYFYYLKNNGLKNLRITDIRIKSSVATNVFYRVVAGSPTYVTGTDSEITNRNLGSSKELTVESKYDTDITGLTASGLLFFERCAVVDTIYHIRTTSNILIPQGQAVAFQREAATGEIECVVSIVEEQ